MKTIHYTFLALAAALPLSGCISLGPKTPDRLLVLTPASPLAAGPARVAGDAQTVAVAPLTAIPALVTPRVLVSDGTNGIAYLREERWTAAPQILFRSLLAETITARTGRVVPDPRLLAVTPNTRLSGQLSSFGYDAANRTAMVVFDATIVREGSDRLEARRFSASAPVASEEGAVVAAGINQAANQVAAEVADWVGSR
ncbi:ABC-type transport auxiliary lipoprotein family protein [uncultured Sphingomonas sp.]|uniref:ABC-type transport auxiliary lipoprotein family protein n=1 Tax=uncultured Sphingomonas sp. TaxID=158754 RepID=UPI0025D3D1D3|nr:ABC-type transport auxiliary lipoprotein family protein [uncultured Sphingomonas sp.]